MINSTTTPLVLSFSGMLWKMMSGKLTLDDISGAVFYFGCMREHALDGCSWGQEVLAREFEQGNRAYNLIRPEITRAAEAGRVAWREMHKPNTWEDLNQLLSNNGLPVIEPPNDHGWVLSDHYCYPAVTAIVQEQKLPYQVIW